MTKATPAVNIINTPQAPHRAAGLHGKKFSQRVSATIQLIGIKSSQCAKAFTVFSCQLLPLTAALTNSME